MQFIKTLFVAAFAVCCTSFCYAQTPIAHWSMNGHALDVTSNGHNATIINNVTPDFGKSGIANTGLYFDGASSYLFIPYQSDMNVSKFTISIIVKPMGFYSGLCQGNYMISRGPEGTVGSYGMEFFDNPYYNYNTFDPTKQVFAMTAGPATYVAGGEAKWAYSPQIVNNTWYCVTGVFDGSTVKMYVDGILKTTFPCSGSPVGSSTNGIYIGMHKWSAMYPYPFKGIIDDIKLYNVALSSEEVLCTDLIEEDDDKEDMAEQIKIVTSEAGNKFGFQTNVNTIQKQLSLSVFPNPATDNITLQAGIDGSYIIYNNVGQMVLNGTTSQHIANINISKLPKGLYYVQLAVDGDNTTQKFIKQ